MIGGRRMRLDPARRSLPFATVTPHDPLACDELQMAVWVDRDRTELLLDYQSGIVITETRAANPRPDWARVVRELGSDASVGRVHGVPALVIQVGREGTHPASVGFVLGNLYVVVYADYAPYSIPTLIRVADSIS